MTTNKCERCNGDGTIQGDIEDLQCPNCRSVCQWCNQPYDDGEPLGDTGLWVCRTCIRDMAQFKEQVAWQTFLSVGFDEYLDTADEFRSDVDAAIKDVVSEYGFERETGEWEVRQPTEDTS